MKKYRLEILCIMTTALGLTCCSKAKTFNLSSNSDKILHYRLSNGLTVVLSEKKNAPLTAVHIRVRAGSIHENGRFGSGISHFIEHAMFLGSEGNPEKDSFSAKIEAFGGANVNAYTTFDHTAYHFTVLSKYTEESLALLKDFIFHPLFPEKEVQNEMGSIISEMDMRDDQVESYFNTITSRLIFKTLPYKYPIIGLKDIFTKLSVQDLKAYYSEKYVPNNMILSIAGDINLPRTASIIETLFGSYAEKPVPSFVYEEEEPYIKQIAELTHQKAQFARVSFMYQTVTYMHPDMYPLDVLSSFLASGKGSILHDLLKEEKKTVEGISSMSWTPAYKGVFEISASLPIIEDKNEIIQRIRQIEKDLDTTLRAIAAGNLDAYRLNTVKREVLTHFINSRETAMDIARGLAGAVMTSGSTIYDEAYLNGIQNVSEKDIIRVINSYFLNKQIKTAILLPPVVEQLYSDSLDESSLTLSPVTSKPGTNDTRIAGIVSDELSPPALKATLEQMARNDENRHSVNTAERITLANGVRILYKKDTSLPKVVCIVSFSGGLEYEHGRNPNGSFDLLSAMMLTSNQSFSKKELIKFLKLHGISIAPFSGKNSFGLTMNFLSDRIAEASSVLAPILRCGSFSEDDFNTEKNDALFEAKTRDENPWMKSGLQFKKIFLRGTPYENPAEGTEESINQITRGSLETLKKNYVTGSNLVISIYGNITKKEIEEKFMQWLDKIPAAPAPEPSPCEFKQIINNENRIYTDMHEGKQAYLRVGYFAPKLGDTHSAACKLMNGYLSGMGGALFKLRSEEHFVDGKSTGGRAYQLGSFYDISKDYGAIVFYAGLGSAAAGEYEWAVKSFYKEIQKIRNTEITPEELHRAKLALLGSEITSAQRLDTAAFNENIFEQYGFGFELFQKSIQEIETVSAQEISSLARTYFSNNYAVHVLMPQNSGK